MFSPLHTCREYCLLDLFTHAVSRPATVFRQPKVALLDSSPGTPHDPGVFASFSPREKYYEFNYSAWACGENLAG